MLRKFKFKLFGTKIYEKQRIFLSLKLRFLKNYVHKKIFTKKWSSTLKMLPCPKAFLIIKSQVMAAFVHTTNKSTLKH